MDTRSDIPPETLRLLLAYNPETGLLTWKPRPRHFFKSEADSKRWHTNWCGKVALAAKTSGYLNGSILCKCGYRAHRVAWAIFYGEWPSLPIDHVNGIRHDNRLANLRLATPQQNSANTAIRSDNTSKYRGVSFDRNRNVWRARLHHNKTTHDLGSFQTPEEAALAFDKAAIELRGAFARRNL